jgi:hypothetical protein
VRKNARYLVDLLKGVEKFLPDNSRGLKIDEEWKRGKYIYRPSYQIQYDKQLEEERIGEEAKQKIKEDEKLEARKENKIAKAEAKQKRKESSKKNKIRKAQEDEKLFKEFLENTEHRDRYNSKKNTQKRKEERKQKTEFQANAYKYFKYKDKYLKLKNKLNV